MKRMWRAIQRAVHGRRDAADQAAGEHAVNVELEQRAAAAAYRSVTEFGLKSVQARNRAG